MKKIICDNITRIIKNKKKLEKELNVKIINKGKELFIESNPEDEYQTERVIDALDFGFPFSTAMSIKKEDLMFEIIKIKEHTKRKDLNVIKGRIIGKKGKTLKILCELTKCNFEVKNNCVGIIGEPEYIKNAQDSIIFLIKGKKQANVYKFLEKHQVKPVIDLGLKCSILY